VKQRWLLAVLALSIAALVVWVGAGFGRAPIEPPSGPASEPPRAAAGRAERRLPEARTLHEQKTSAYHARLFAEEDGVVVVTQTGFTTLEDGQAPREHSVSLGPVAARLDDALVFWRSGSLRELSLSGERERELAPLPRTPQYLLGEGGRLVWIYSDRGRGSSVQTLSGGQARVVYESSYGISAPVIHSDAVYWVAESPDGSWKVERMELEGRPTSSPAHRGRLPSMLGAGRDGIYFYDGPERGIRRLTFDLERETSVLGGVVCSPLVVTDRVLCAQVGGLFEVPLSGEAARFVAPERAGPITALAAAGSRVFWVADHGAEQLIIRSVTLEQP
jgi:hypothetical protein